MILTPEQQRKVELNMGLVGKVIKDKVHGTNQYGIFNYDDLFQIGCIGLCKAAVTDKGGHFSTYAYRLIWNEICDALIYANRRKETEHLVDFEMMSSFVGNSPEELSDESIALQQILEKAKAGASVTVCKGIDALSMMAQGYTSREIGDQMGVAPNLVTAWISKARKYLTTLPELQQLYALGGSL